MALTAQYVIKTAITALQDYDNVRWTVPDLVEYLNDGQRQLAIDRPDALQTTATVALVAGARQAIPADGTKLIGITRNDSSWSTRAVREINMNVLDAQFPQWFNTTATYEVRHYMYDERSPLMFHVYPPALAGCKVQMIYAQNPTDIPVPAAGSAYTAVTGNLAVIDIFANPLRDYVMYRAFAKDSEFAGNLALATAYKAAYDSAVKGEVQATTAVAPKDD